MKITNLQNLMVSISMLKNMACDLLSAGFTNVFRTKADQEKLNARYEAKAEKTTPSLDVHRLGRTDAAGNTQVDGGRLIFTAEGQKVVTPKNLVDDLTKHGYHLAVAETFEKEGDKNVRLRLTWSKNASTKVRLSDCQKKVARKYFDLTYWKIFGFFNLEALSLEEERSPIKGSIVTLNFSGVMNAGQALHKDIREIRMVDEDGHLACPIISTASATPQRYPEPPGNPAQSAESAFDQGLKSSIREPRRICPDRTPERFLKASPAEAFDRGLRSER